MCLNTENYTIHQSHISFEAKVHIIYSIATVLHFDWDNCLFHGSV